MDHLSYPVLIYTLVLFVFVIAYIFRAKIKISEVIKNLIIWSIIIFFLFVGYSYKNSIKNVLNRVYANIIPGAIIQTKPYEVQVYENELGQFYVNAVIRNTAIKFLIDTGASNVLLKWEDAQLLGIDMDLLQFTIKTQTANGVAYSAPVKINSITIGDIVINDVKCLVASKNSVSISLLGMNFLRQLHSFETKGDVLTMRGYKE